VRQREEFAVQFDDAMRSTDKEWRCRLDELKRACDASLLRESELKRSVELESLRRRESDAALKEARESLAQAQEMLRDSNWRGDDLQGQVDALIQARDMLAIEHQAAHERVKAANERLLSEASATNRTLEAEAARLQDEIARARSAHAVDLQRLQVPRLFAAILLLLLLLFLLLIIISAGGALSSCQ
jgi:Fe2+ transport system protein B